MLKKNLLRRISILLIMAMFMVSIPFQAVFAADEPVTSSQTEVSTDETVQTAEQEVESKTWTPTEDEIKDQKVEDNSSVVDLDEVKKQNTNGDLSLAELKDKVLTAEDIPEVIDAETVAEKGHVNRLRAQEEDLNTVIFQNVDGTKTIYYFAEPVKYVDENGEVRDKSYKISETTDESGIYKYSNTANDVRTLFPEKLSKDSGVTLKYNDVEITMSHIISQSNDDSMAKDDSIQNSAELNNVDEALAEKSSYETPEKERKESVVYNEIFGEKTELRYTPTLNGFKEDIILNEYTSQNTFEFVLKTSGLSLVTVDGLFYLADPLTGVIIAAIGEICVYDSGEAKIMGSIEAAVVIEDNEYLLTIKVDEEYLKSAKTIYPIYIDPSFNIVTSASNTTIYDTSIYSLNPNVNYGDYICNYVGNISNIYSAMSGVGRLLIKTPGLLNNGIFSLLDEDQVLSVGLNIYKSFSYQNQTIFASVFNRAWTESTAKCGSTGWSNSGYLMDWKYITSNNPQWLNFNISNAVKTWMADSSYVEQGIILWSNSESTSGCYSSFCSTEGSNKPYITVTYDTGLDAAVNSGNVYNIQNANTGYYMTVDGTTNNSVVIQTSLTTSASQVIKFSRQSNGFYKLYPQNSSSKILTLNTFGFIVVGDDCDTDSCLWRLKRNDDGTYYIVSKVNIYSDPKYMIIYNNGSTSGNLISTGSVNYSSAKWNLLIGKVNVTSVNLLESVFINAGETRQMSATVYPTNATDRTVHWTSSNMTVATVNYNSGLVSAISAGTTTIVATSADNCYEYDTCIISVGCITYIDGTEIAIIDEYVYDEDSYEYGTGTVEASVIANGEEVTTARIVNGVVTVCFADIAYPLCTSVFIDNQYTYFDVEVTHSDTGVYVEKRYYVSNLGACPINSGITDRISLIQFLNDMGYANKFSCITYANGSKDIVIEGPRGFSESQEALDSVTSVSIGLLPGVGDVKDLVDGVTGKDFITGESLTTAERVFSIFCSCMPYVNGAIVRVGKRGIANVDEIIDIADSLSDTERAVLRSNVWSSLNPFRRGVFIEADIAKTVYKSADNWYNIGQEMGGKFPCIDFINMGENLADTKVISLKSLDPSLYTGNTAAYKINNYARKLLDTKITAGEATVVYKKLSVVIPKGTRNLIGNLNIPNGITLEFLEY